MEALGLSLPHRVLVQIGTTAKKQYISQYNQPPLKKWELVGDYRYNTYHYPEDFLPCIDQIIRDVPTPT